MRNKLRYLIARLFGKKRWDISNGEAFSAETIIYRHKGISYIQSIKCGKIDDKP